MLGPFIVFGAVIIFALFWFIFNRLLEVLRTRGFEKNAAKFGFTYDRVAPESLDSLTELFSLFKIGHYKKSGNFITKTINDAEFTLFDYTFKLKKGKARYSNHCSVVAITDRSLRLPQVYVRPIHYAHNRVMGVPNLKHIPIERDEEFEKNFLSRGSNVKALQKLLNDEVIAWLKDKGIVVLEAKARHIILYRLSYRFPTDKLEDAIEEAHELLSLIKKVSLSD